MENNKEQSKISKGRKVMYYGGMALSAIGVLTFISNIFIPFIPFVPFRESMRFVSGNMFIALGSMAIMVIGRSLMFIGKMGVAGAGLILDPDKARKDIEPWSHMAGGVINDAAKEVDLSELMGKVEGTRQEVIKEVIKVKCRNCSALNDEDAKFCKACGKAI